MTNYYFKIYAITLVIFMVIDLTWLSLMAPTFYLAQVRQPLARAALYGLVTYGTYELSNLTTLKEWSVSLTVVDTFWGICVSTVVSLISLRIARGLSPLREQRT